MQYALITMSVHECHWLSSKNQKCCGQ